MAKPFPPEIYEKISINDLILVSLYQLERLNKKISFEELLKSTFELFPKKFGFEENIKWPDSRKIDRPLRTFRRKKLISGDPAKGFSLTKNGQKRAKQTMNLLRQMRLRLK